MGKWYLPLGFQVPQPGVLGMIISPRLPEFNGFLDKFRCGPHVLQHVRMMMVGILTPRERMSAQQAGSAIDGESRHRGTIGRFLKRYVSELGWMRFYCTRQLLKLSQPQGRHAFVGDTTLVDQQGHARPTLIPRAIAAGVQPRVDVTASMVALCLMR